MARQVIHIALIVAAADALTMQDTRCPTEITHHVHEARVSTQANSRDRMVDVAQGIARASTPFNPPSINVLTDARDIVAPMWSKLAAADAPLDCQAALLMYEYSLTLMPSRIPFLDAFESLRLDLDCGITPPPPAAANAALVLTPLTHAERQEMCTHEVFVCPASGRDVARGSLTEPLLTLHAALSSVRAARAMHAGGLGTACIVLRGGTHYVRETLTLSPSDSGLVFTSYPGDAPTWVSGGVPLLGLGQWQPYNVTPDGLSNIWVADVPASIPVTSMPSLLTQSPHTRLTNAQFPNFDIETGSASGEVPGPWDGQGAAAMNWTKPALFPQPDVYYLGAVKNDSTMACYNLYSTGRGGPCDLWAGEDGGSGNYYCGNTSGGGWVEVDARMQSNGLLQIPIGMRYNASALPSFASWSLPPMPDKGDWSNAATLTVWQGAPGGGGEWYNNRFAIIEHDAASSYITLTEDGVWPSGGWQGGRNWHTLDAPQGNYAGPLIGGPWHVNGVFAELDYPGEYYFDAPSRKLYLFYNTSVYPPGVPLPSPTSPPPNDLVLVAPTLEVFFNMTGTPSSPVTDVMFAGLGFRDQKDGFLEPWMLPSGGDWALRRAGLLNLNGTERITVDGCAFIRTDGNAIMVSGYARNVTVSNNEFAWTGMSAVAQMGSTAEEDGTAGTQPWGTVMASNVVREIGILEKQSSAMFMGKTPLTRIEGNVFFNGPRAMINFNDGLGGGHNVTQNAIWNTCRESGDHGPLNSWNREPLLSTIGTGGASPSFTPAYTATHHNFIIANDGGSESFDNDDGSSFYDTYDNFFTSSDGWKMDYGGHDSRFHGNIVVTRQYDGQNCVNGGDFMPGHESEIFNNTCIVPAARGSPEHVDPNIGSTACSGLPWGSGTLIAYGNAYYTPAGNASAFCPEINGGTWVPIMNITPPTEQGSTAAVLPPDAVIIAWGRALLGL